MATQLEIVNNILIYLREDTVSSVEESSYSKLLAKFVNDAKSDLEDITFDWAQYRTVHTVSITGDSSTTSYTIDGTNHRSIIPSIFNNREIPLAFDVTDAGEKFQLYRISNTIYTELSNTQNYEATEKPSTFSTFFSSDGLLGFTILQPATTDRTWKIITATPQARLALDGTDDNTEIKLPERPIERRALYYALNERGEEMGEPGGIAFVNAQNAIAAALERNREVLQTWELTQFTRQEHI